MASQTTRASRAAVSGSVDLSDPAAAVVVVGRRTGSPSDEPADESTSQPLPHPIAATPDTGSELAADPDNISPGGVTRPRQRASRACDACRRKRTRCNGYGPPCGPCEENGLECVYQNSGKKRGPPKGYKPVNAKRKKSEDARTLAAGTVGPSTGRRPAVPTKGASQMPSSGPVRPPKPSAPVTDSRPLVSRLPSDVLSNAYIEYLLALYFAHTHVVWPIIYKPMFHHPRALPALMWSILALAACISPTPTASTPAEEMTADALFDQALLETQRYLGESRIELVQALVLLSLRQTGCGMKSSAWLHCGQACAMAIDLGLHNAGRVGQSGQKAGGSEEARRVYWNCYVLDKTLSEETGRPYILRGRRCTTPLPSVLEPDEFEPWPPTLSSHSLPTLSRISPRRASALTAFNSTCRLALIVERIMDLDEEGPCLEVSTLASGANGEGTARPGGMRQVEDPEMLRLRDVLSEQLDEWWMLLPEAIQVQGDVAVCPLPHFVVNVAWYHSARILLHSRFINAASREYDRHSSSAAKYFGSPLDLLNANAGNDNNHRRVSSSPDVALVRSHGLSHAICTEAADEIVKLISLLDRWKLLSSSSSDVIHLVSHATLFQVYNSSLPDVGLANRAKMNFVQCCQWLKTFSSSWPAASHHKTFFEGLISGGLDLSPVNDSDPHINPAIFPNPPQAADGQPGDRLAHVDPALNALGYPGGQRQAPPAQTPMLSPTSFFKTPSYFWNQAVPSAISAGLGTGLGAIDPAALQNQQQGGFGQQSLDGSSQQDAWASPGDFLDGLGSTAGSGGGFDSGSGSAGGAIGSHQDGPVNNSVYDALMAYMLESSSAGRVA